MLRGASLRVPRGQRVAVVGGSGGGKSTLMRLALRLYEPAAGRVTLGGADVRDVPPAELAARVAVVAQEPQLFALTIRENIACVRRRRRRRRSRSLARPSTDRPRPVSVDRSCARRAIGPRTGAVVEGAPPRASSRSPSASARAVAASSPWVVVRPTTRARRARRRDRGLIGGGSLPGSFTREAAPHDCDRSSPTLRYGLPKLPSEPPAAAAAARAERDAAVERAAALANVDAFVSKLPDG